MELEDSDNSVEIITAESKKNKKIKSNPKSSAASNKQNDEAKKAAAKEKLTKKIAQKQQKNIQPGECMKFIEVEMKNIEINFDFYQETVNMLESASVIHTTKSSLGSSSNEKEGCVTWTRINEEYSIDYNNQLKTTINKERDDNVLIIWKWNQVVKKIHDKTLGKSISSLIASMPEQTRLTLVIYGMEYYFSLKKNKNKQNSQRNDHQLHSISLDEIPKISNNDFELSLIEIQLIGNCNTRLIENSSDMSLLIYQYTKAIAEKKYKLEIKNRLHDQIDFFAAGDNKKTIKVDDDGHGMKNLWLKQLCMFNSTNIAVANAISSTYSTPDELINAYMNCSDSNEGEELLKDIEIKKSAAGPLAKVRKLGPELSRKIHTMFTSINAEELLN